MVEKCGLTGQHVRDFTLYSGALGTAFLLFKAYQVDKTKNDLGLCLEIVKACDSSSSASRYSSYLFSLYVSVFINLNLVQISCIECLHTRLFQPRCYHFSFFFLCFH